MSRHSKNNTGSSIFTYGERQKLKNSNEWGEISSRIGTDSQKQFEQCNLCLNLIKNPVICRKGHIYCKECILENLIFQKKKNKKKISEWEESNLNNNQAAIAKDALVKISQLKQVEESSNNTQIIENSQSKPNGTKDMSLFSKKRNEESKKTDKCFWIPEQTPINKDNKISKPKEYIRIFLIT